MSHWRPFERPRADTAYLRELADYFECRILDGTVAAARLRQIADSIDSTLEVCSHIRGPDGDYIKCPICAQYLNRDGACPEGCGTVGEWLARYQKAQALCEADWEKYRNAGWSWAIGWNPEYGGYFAQVWRRLKRAVRIDGRLKLKECHTESGKTIAEAEAKLRKRLEGPKGGDRHDTA